MFLKFVVMLLCLTKTITSSQIEDHPELHFKRNWVTVKEPGDLLTRVNEIEDLACNPAQKCSQSSYIVDFTYEKQSEDSVVVDTALIIEPIYKLVKLLYRAKLDIEVYILDEVSPDNQISKTLLVSKSAEQLRHSSNISLGVDLNDLLNSQQTSDVVLQVQLITRDPHRLATEEEKGQVLSYVPAVVVKSTEVHSDFLTLFEADNENPNKHFEFSAYEDAKLMEGTDNYEIGLLEEDHEEDEDEEYR